MAITLILLTLVHVLAGAAWFGAMFYSLTVLHPKARRFFADDQRIEKFVATLAQRARWKVLSAFALMFSTGAAMTFLGWRSPPPRAWLVLVAVKAALLLAALLVFVHASWRLWPARVFATSEELPRWRRRFQWIGLTMQLLVGLNLVLGVLTHLL